MNTCNKMSYESAKEARKDIKVLHSRVGKKQIKSLRPYMCDCGDWHTTSLSKKQSKELSRSRKEVSRRLGIVDAIRKNNTISKVLSVQEGWMTLVLGDKNTWLECSVLNKKKFISLTV